MIFWERWARHNADFLIQQLALLVSGPPVGAAFLFRTDERTLMGEITVPDDETTLRSTLAALDAEGHPTTFEGTPTYTSSDESVATVTPSDDGLTATYEIGAPGDAVITVDTGETDDDGNPIVGKGTIHVTPGGVAVLSVDFETG